MANLWGAMETIILRSDPQPSVLAYPDFLLKHMLECGPSFLETDLSWELEGQVEVRLRPRKQPTTVLALIPARQFRPILARFAIVTGMDDPYGSVHTFACDHFCEGQLRPHYFRAFLCNEGAMGMWLRVYLYGIAGIYPFRFEATEESQEAMPEIDWNLDEDELSLEELNKIVDDSRSRH